MTNGETVAPARSPRTPFATLARAYASSLGGDACVAVALAGSLFFKVPADSARTDIALYLLVTMTPFALVAPVLGPVLDRARSRRVTLAAVACVGRAVLCVLMARHLDSPLLYPEAFGMLVLMKSYQVAKSAMTPTVVSSPDELVRANSRLTLAGVFGGIVVGGVAAGIMQLLGGSWVLAFGAVAYLVSARLTTLVPASGGMEDDVGSSEPGPPLGQTATEGHASAIKPAHLHGIRLAAIAMAVLRSGVGFVVFLLAFALKREGEPAWFYGLVIAASAIGGFVGAVAAPRLRRLLREEAVLVVSLALPAAAAVFGARSEARPAALMVALALGIGGSSGRAGFDSLVQRDAPGSSWGRAFARFEAYFQLAWVLGAFIPVLVSISPGIGMLILALILGAGGFVYLAGLAADSLLHASR